MALVPSTVYANYRQSFCGMLMHADVLLQQLSCPACTFNGPQGLSTHALVMQTLPNLQEQGQPQRQMQLLNPLSWSPVLQGLAAASLMLAAALVWSTVRRPSAGIRNQHTP